MAKEFTQEERDAVALFDQELEKVLVLKYIPLPARRWVVYMLDYLNEYEFAVDSELYSYVSAVRDRKGENELIVPPLARESFDAVMKYVLDVLDGPAIGFDIPGCKLNLKCTYPGKKALIPPKPDPVENPVEQPDGDDISILREGDLPSGDDFEDSDNDGDFKRHFSSLSDRPIDLSKMNIKHSYKYLVGKMSTAAKKKFDDILQMSHADLTTLCWALKMGGCAMMAKPLTPPEILEAAGIPDADVISPYEVMNTLADTITTRVLANKAYDIYMDPGTNDIQVVVCRIGAVLIHSKHNVAFGAEENQYLLRRFVKCYKTNHLHVVKLVQNKMALLPEDPVSGVFMKYRPKRVAFKYVDVTGQKVKDYNRFEIELKSHGCYEMPPFAMPSNIDLLSLAMTTVGSSPLALFSVMTRDVNGKKILEEFVKQAETNIEEIESDDLLDYFSETRLMLDGNMFNVPHLMYDYGQLDDAFESMLMLNIIPIIAKDKGIYNDLRRVLHLYGCVTLHMAIVLRFLDSGFASRSWITYSATDVSNMLKLNVVHCDSLTAPGREGVCKPMAPNVPTNNAPVRGKEQRQLILTYLPPPIESIPKILDKKKNVLLPSLMDLAYSGRFFEVSDRKGIDKKIRGGNTRTAMDHYYHDHSSAKYCSCPLFALDGQGKPAAKFENFVVVMPLSVLTAAYCKQLFSVYNVRFILGAPSMNYSVYLIGRRVLKGDTSHAAIFRRWISHLLVRRLKMYRLAHAGFLTSVRDIVSHVHKEIDATEFIQECVSTYKDDEFLSNFKKSASTASLAVLDAIMPVAVDMSKLSVAVDVSK
jgi:hypothetical protein